MIEATGTHPFWIVTGDNLENRTKCNNLTNSDSELTPQGRWVYAQDVRVGDVVLGRAQKAMKVSSVESRCETVQVYNFIVDDLHSYAIGTGEMLVHNQSMMPPDSAFTSLEDAIGDIHGYAKVVGTAKAKAKLYVDNGYTKIIYAVDSNGKQHTVAFNPTTNLYWVSHDSSRW